MNFDVNVSFYAKPSLLVFLPTSDTQYVPIAMEHMTCGARIIRSCSIGSGVCVWGA